MRGRPRLAPLVERDARVLAMAELYRQGRTLKSIGEAYGLTRERVRQLLKGVVSREEGGIAVTASAKWQAREDRLNAACLEKHGMSRAEYKAVPQKARAAFIRQKANAGTRGIEWRIKFADWWRIWRESGKWEQRGRGYGYVMGRHGDCGPYAPDNVYICTQAQNSADQYIWKPVGSEQRKSPSHWRRYEYQGESLHLGQWADRVGIHPNTICERIRRGWSIERALTEPVHADKRTHFVKHEVRAA